MTSIFRLSRTSPRRTWRKSGFRSVTVENSLQLLQSCPPRRLPWWNRWVTHRPTRGVPTERRQVTVVFVDVVESTALSAELDPEDLLRLLRRYREECVAVIEKYEGFVAQYLGDGMLVYFGFPQAQEHAAERAVRAALEIVKAVSQIKRPDKLSLQCRIGIATGMVISTEFSVGTHGEETVVGDAPNLRRTNSNPSPSPAVCWSGRPHINSRDIFLILRLLVSTRSKAFANRAPFGR